MKLNEILGTEFPLIQGGMANIATGEFAAAVSNAGALGLIGAGGMPGFSFPSWTSSSRAMGMLAAEVLPYRSIFL